MPKAKRVYLDESGISRFVQRENGRALRGVKVMDTKRGRKFKRTNVIAGMCGGKHMAVTCYDHTTTAEFFERWFEDDLLPMIPKGFVIIMDNASFHRKSALFKLASNAGVRLLFLPPYSPDFNPIEHTWANLKRWLQDKIHLFAFAETAIFDYFCYSNY